MRSASEPGTSSRQIPRFDQGFSVRDAQWIWIEGFEVRFFGRGEWAQGILLWNTSHAVVRNNRVHGAHDGISVLWNSDSEADGNDTRIESNTRTPPD